MHILLINNETTSLNALQQLLLGHDITQVSWKTDYMHQAKACDAIVLSGGHQISVADHEKEFGPELNFIRTSKKPIVGICLGFELICAAFGGTLERLPHRMKGVRSIEALQGHAIFRGLRRFDVFDNHRWAVTRLPNELRPLARSEAGFEIVHHNERPIWGVQFHPEILRDSTAGAAVFINILRLVQPLPHS
jgi:GMP synthase-like glutamine amidotransferase